nr:Imm52 family immunity protein [Caballeronia novacaledonica]
MRYDIEGTSQLSFQFGRVAATGYSRLVDLLEKTFQILPPIVAELGAYDYYTKDVRNPGRRVKVFPDRPGVGWMLYLPRRIEIEQVPEARMIHHVKDLNGTEGTILISEIDGPFDADNPEHVKVANAIEIRLADQDLLPRYVDLS